MASILDIEPQFEALVQSYIKKVVDFDGSHVWQCREC